MVLDGLNPNDAVVVRGAPYLDDGTPVVRGTQVASVIGAADAGLIP